MNLFKRLFGKKQPQKKEQKNNSSSLFSGSNYSRRDDSMDLSDPLNPLSPIWYGHSSMNNDNYVPQESSHSHDFGGGSFGGGGAGGSWEDSSISYDSDGSSSYDSGSSSSDSGSYSSD
jgi:uncharacterized membrane protein YgcG